MSERLIATKILAPALLVGLGLTACTGDKDPAATTVNFTEKKEDFGVDTSYTPSGKRITTLGEVSTKVYAYCDGGDLVEQPVPYSDPSTNIERSPDHDACDDGKLEPKDFGIEEE